MAINYSNVTYITNGQAITATNLNAPSVDLATRSVEVQRNALYEDFLEEHSNSVEVRLEPLMSSSQDASYSTITSHLFDAGSNEYLKAYSFSLTDASLSIYAPREPGSRYVVKGSDISSYFSNIPAGGLSGTFINSVQLHVPGDGLYLKRPTKYVSSVTDSGSHAESVLPNTEASSVGRTYLDANQNLSGSIVKLPIRNKVTFSSTGYTVATFLAAINAGTWGSGAISNLAATVNSSNELSITDGSDTFTLYITGLQNVKAEVNKVYVENTNLVLELSNSTAPIYHQVASAACSNIGLTLYSSENLSASANGGTLIINQSSAQYAVGLVDLDSSYMYIPLARLTETSLVIGNREYSLLRNYISNNSSYSTTHELVDLHGAPIEYLDTSLSSHASKSYKVDLRSELPIPRGKVTLGKRSTIVSNKLRCDFSRDPQLLRLLEFNKGSTLNLLEIRVTVLKQVTTASSATSFRVGNYVKAKNASDVVVNNIFFGDTNSLSYVTIPSDSLNTASNELSVTSALGTAFNVLNSTLVTSKTDCVIEISESGGIVIDQGEVYVELDLLI